MLFDYYLNEEYPVSARLMSYFCNENRRLSATWRFGANRISNIRIMEMIVGDRFVKEGLLTVRKSMCNVKNK